MGGVAVINGVLDATGCVSTFENQPPGEGRGARRNSLLPRLLRCPDITIPMDEPPEGGEVDIRFEFIACAETGIGADGGASTSIGLTGLTGLTGSESSAGISDRRRERCFRGLSEPSERGVRLWLWLWLWWWCDEWRCEEWRWDGGCPVGPSTVCCSVAPS